jgi:hypothetical protein
MSIPIKKQNQQTDSDNAIGNMDFETATHAFDLLKQEECLIVNKMKEEFDVIKQRNAELLKQNEKLQQQLECFEKEAQERFKMIHSEYGSIIEAFNKELHFIRQLYVKKNDTKFITIKKGACANAVSGILKSNYRHDVDSNGWNIKLDQDVKIPLNLCYGIMAKVKHGKLFTITDSDDEDSIPFSGLFEIEGSVLCYKKDDYYINNKKEFCLVLSSSPKPLGKTQNLIFQTDLEIILPPGTYGEMTFYKETEVII